MHIEIFSEDKPERRTYNRPDGTSSEWHTLTAYLHAGGRFPIAFELSFTDPAEIPLPGKYAFSSDSFVVEANKKLSFARRLKLVPAK